MATKFLIPITVWSLLLGSCSISRQQMSSFSDDVYASPSELKTIAKAKALAQAKQDSLAKQALADSAAVQTARDNANPYYQDPNYNKDDYYDYEYASRINRFNNPVAGASYYDNYYTNMYTYNQNPANYGTSIYSTYNYMPSTQFGMMSSGIGTGFGNSFYNGFNMGYNNMGYNNFGSGMGMGYGNPYGMGMGYSTYPYYSNSFGYNNYYNPLYSYNMGGYYNPYSATGFYNGYNTGYGGYYNNGWGGYLNTYDPNSAYANMDYAPRTSGNTNTGARVVGGTQIQSNDGRQQLYNAYVQQQNNTPRFSNAEMRSTNINNATFNQSRTNNFQNANLNNGGNRATQGQTQTNYGGNNSTRVNNEGHRASTYDNNTNNNPTGRSMNENSGWNSGGARSGGGFNGGGGGFSPRGGGGGGGRGGR